MHCRGIKVVDRTHGKHVCVTEPTIYALIEQEDGTVEEVDISAAVHKVTTTLEYGAVATAVLHVYSAAFEVEDIRNVMVEFAQEKEPQRPWSRSAS